MSDKLFIGIMSGTSIDSIDTALVSFNDDKQQSSLVATHEHAFPDTLREKLQALIHKPDLVSLDLVGSADRELGLVYAAAVKRLLQTSARVPTDITAIGCHGQTIRHQPDANPAFTLQIGDGATLAAATGICVVNDFRSADIATGGQGAPLAPLFHAWAFSSDAITGVANIGGIANLTVLNPNRATTGCDTGPGNTLMDAWCETHTGERLDKDGAWARSGTVCDELLERCLADPFFHRSAPKSTGREHFNLDWLNQQGCLQDLAPADVQATLTELTARSLCDKVTAAGITSLKLCGGGAMNTFLYERITALAGDIAVTTTAAAGLPPEWVEAVAFAWLARERMAAHAIQTPSVTGSRQAGHLGALHLPPAV